MSDTSNSIAFSHPLYALPHHIGQKIQEGFQAEPDPIDLWAAAQRGPRKWRNKQLKVELSQLLEYQQRQLQAWCVAANIGYNQVAKMAFAKSRRWSGDSWSLWQGSKMEYRAFKNGNGGIEARKGKSESCIIKTFETAVVTHSHASLLLLHYPRTDAGDFRLSRRSHFSSIYYHQALDKCQGDKNALVEEIHRQSMLSFEDENEEFDEEAIASACQGSDKQTQRALEVNAFHRTITSMVSLFALNEMLSLDVNIRSKISSCSTKLALSLSKRPLMKWTRMNGRHPRKQC